MKKISVLIIGLCLCVGAHAATIEVLPITIPVVVGGAMPGQYVKNGSEYTFHIPVDDIRKDVPQLAAGSLDALEEKTGLVLDLIAGAVDASSASAVESAAAQLTTLPDGDDLKRAHRAYMYKTGENLGVTTYYFHNYDAGGWGRITHEHHTDMWKMQKLVLGTSLADLYTVGFYWNEAESRLMRMKSQGDMLVEYSETTACLLPDDETGDLYELTAAEKAELPTVPA